MVSLSMPAFARLSSDEDEAVSRPTEVSVAAGELELIARLTSLGRAHSRRSEQDVDRESSIVDRQLG